MYGLAVNELRPSRPVRLYHRFHVAILQAQRPAANTHQPTFPIAKKHVRTGGQQTLNVRLPQRRYWQHESELYSSGSRFRTNCAFSILSIANGFMHSTSNALQASGILIRLTESCELFSCVTIVHFLR